MIPHSLYHISKENDSKIICSSCGKVRRVRGSILIKNLILCGFCKGKREYSTTIPSNLPYIKSKPKHI
jgi:hypothetical protein